MLIILGITLTVICRNYAVARRVSMGLSPSWGSEYAPLLIIGICYFTLKADWSFD